jgi:hypothetical protein
MRRMPKFKLPRFRISKVISLCACPDGSYNTPRQRTNFLSSDSGEPVRALSSLIVAQRRKYQSLPNWATANSTFVALVRHVLNRLYRFFASGQFDLPHPYRFLFARVCSRSGRSYASLHSTRVFADTRLPGVRNVRKGGQTTPKPEASTSVLAPAEIAPPTQRSGLGESTRIPWTLSNKYYSADVHFAAHTITGLSPHVVRNVPAVIFVWSKGEVGFIRIVLWDVMQSAQRSCSELRRINTTWNALRGT